MTDKKPFLLRPEDIGDAAAHFDRGSVLLSASQAPDPRDGSGPMITRILNGDAAEFIMMTYVPGQVLADHRAAHPIMIQCLEGRLELAVGEERYELIAGRIAHLSAMVVHRVECPPDAPARNVLLLTMLTGSSR